jgi:hypothetical protein
MLPRRQLHDFPQQLIIVIAGSGNIPARQFHRRTARPITPPDNKVLFPIPAARIERIRTMLPLSRLRSRRLRNIEKQAFYSGKTSASAVII